MPVITVDYPKGKFSPGQRDALAEAMTQVILQIEGGADTPAGRSIAWVKFNEIDREDWYIGGDNSTGFEGAAGKFFVELNVPEGSMDQARKSECHQAIFSALLDATGTTDVEGAAQSIFIQIVEWPEGHLAANGKTSSLLGIARQAGIPANHPLLKFPRAYFEAKDRLYDLAEFPDKTAGRALVRY